MLTIDSVFGAFIAYVVLKIVRSVGKNNNMTKINVLNFIIWALILFIVSFCCKTEEGKGEKKDGKDSKDFLRQRNSMEH